MTICSVKLSSCIGCSPKYTFIYQLLNHTDGLSLIKEDCIKPSIGIRGGYIHYIYYFETNCSSGKETATFVKKCLGTKDQEFITYSFCESVEPVLISNSSV
jgi:hypothetical protein